MDSLHDFLTIGGGGLSHWDMGHILVYILAVTGITSDAVGIFLHRRKVHRALKLPKFVVRLFRFWLWLTVGMVLVRWIEGARVYRDEDEVMVAKYGDRHERLAPQSWVERRIYRALHERLVPESWMERRIYRAFPSMGLLLMLVVNVVLFGYLGIAVWVVQMLWALIEVARIVKGPRRRRWSFRDYSAGKKPTSSFPWAS